MSNSNDSLEEQGPNSTPEDARWRRLLGLLVRVETRHLQDREDWKKDQAEQARAVADLAVLVRLLLRVLLPVGILAGIGTTLALQALLHHLHLRG